MSARAIGLYLGVVNFAFALCWIVYLIWLPSLVVQAGLPPQAAAWLLMADQAVFLVCDYLAGVAADRASRVLGRVGLWVLAATVVSALAFLALPFVAPQGSPLLLVACTLVWAVTSSALRAPPLALIGRYAAKPSQPAAIALVMLGAGVAAALAPYLGLTLKAFDPRWPFALSSVALVAVTLGLVAAERRLARDARDGAAAQAPAAPASATADEQRGAARAPLFIAAAAVAALAFQAHVFVDSAVLYRRFAPPSELPWLLPLFWVGFNVGLMPMSIAAKRWPWARVMGGSAALAAGAAMVATLAPSLDVLVVAQLAAGVGWAGVLLAAFAWATAIGRSGVASGGPGAWAGAVSSVLAGATLLRIAATAAGWPADPVIAAWLAWWPAIGWLGAGIAIAVLLRGRLQAHVARR